MSIKKLTFFFAFFLLFQAVYSQETPRLVIGITVDQMRYDYLYKYWNDLGEGGFKRLLGQGFVAHNGHFNYAPTYTGPGHASIYTGTGPAHHGIIGNEWYSRKDKRKVYCVEDESVRSIGEGATSGQASPKRLTATTVIDQLELGTNDQAKTMGVSIKDRGAILPAGHHADAAYWVDKANLRFISSSAYLDSLPDWVKAFNSMELPQQYLAAGWQLRNSIEMYNESQPDSSQFELPFRNTDAAVFPYDLKKISETRAFGVGETAYDVLATSPQGNELVVRFVEAAIEAEGFGQDNIPDMIAMSFSSTDYAGHRFGPHSVEVQDMYLRLDSLLSEFLSYVDSVVGLEQTLVFLTADHGAADVPAYVKAPAGYFKGKTFEGGLRSYLTHKFGVDPIESVSNQQIYLTQIDSVDYEQVEYEIRRFAMRFSGVMNVVKLGDWSTCSSREEVCTRLRNGYHPQLSGDLYIQLYPGWIDYNPNGGTTHGSPYAYDTHVPIIFFGWKVAPQQNYERIYIEDIAPTVSDALRISLPSGCTGRALDIY
ncbi:MAG: alkaline phosphatase family protein [Bacteroidetes bacterium]|nr:MAG: alkaline phosphatase family protein [Bacteroidota bacterium]